MASSNLLSKSELAGATYGATILTAAELTANIVTGEATDDKAAPAVGFVADNSPEEDPPFSGNFWVGYSVKVRSIAAIDADGVDPKTAHDLLSATIFDAFQSDDITTQLTDAQSGFTVQGVVYDGLDNNPSGDCLESILKMRLYCCASDL